VRWWTWAGAAANATLATALGEVAEPSRRPANLWLRLRADATRDEVEEALDSARRGPLPAPPVSRAAVRGLKFADALPDDLAVKVLAARMADVDGARRALAEVRTYREV
ncbi:MAG: DEAD/DEAH box helicase, partial [Streptosporangiaceae bacterium]